MTDSLAELAKDSDVLILQNMGPILDFDALSFESQYLLNVSRVAATLRTASCVQLRVRCCACLGDVIC